VDGDAIAGLEADAMASLQTRFQGLASLFKAVGSQIGEGSYPILGSIFFLNAEAAAAEICREAAVQPILGLLADLAVNIMLSITAGVDPGEMPFPFPEPGERFAG
jgi:hypothetical protein